MSGKGHAARRRLAERKRKAVAEWRKSGTSDYLVTEDGELFRLHEPIVSEAKTSDGRKIIIHHQIGL